MWEIIQFTLAGIGVLYLYESLNTRKAKERRKEDIEMLEKLIAGYEERNKVK